MGGRTKSGKRQRRGVRVVRSLATPSFYCGVRHASSVSHAIPIGLNSPAARSRPTTSCLLVPACIANFYFSHSFLPPLIGSVGPLLFSYAPPTKLPIAASCMLAWRNSGRERRAPISLLPLSLSLGLSRSLSLSPALTDANGNGPLPSLQHSFIQDSTQRPAKRPSHFN